MLIRAVVGRYESFNASYYSLVACCHLHHWQRYPWPSIWWNITTHLSTGDPSHSKSIQVSLMLHNLSCRILSDSVSLLGGPLADQYTPRLCIFCTSVRYPEPFCIPSLPWAICCPEMSWVLRIIKAASDVISEHFDQYEVEDLRFTAQVAKTIPRVESESNRKDSQESRYCKIL